MTVTTLQLLLTSNITTNVINFFLFPSFPVSLEGNCLSLYKRINEHYISFWFSSLHLQGRWHTAKMKTLLLSLITDKLKHCRQTLLYSSVAVYLSHGQTCARAGKKKKRNREKKERRVSFLSNTDKALMFCLAETRVKFLSS